MRLNTAFGGKGVGREGGYQVPDLLPRDSALPTVTIWTALGQLLLCSATEYPGVIVSSFPFHS